MFAPPSEAVSVTFTDFSTGFDEAADTGSQMQNGITFSYSDDDVIDLRTATASFLDIKNTFDATQAYLGYFTLSFTGVPAGHYLEMDVSGFYYNEDAIDPNSGKPFGPNKELMQNFSVVPDSVITNGPTWTGSELLTTNISPGTATLRFNTAPSTLSIEYGSQTNHVFFELHELRIGENKSFLGIEAFVIRFYELCLGRLPDAAGLEDWVTALLNGSQTGSDVAYGFVFSQEFLNKNTTNEEYLQVLYEAFFNRQPDVSGFQGWLDAMQDGASREDVLKGFIFAQEFAALCQNYGIKAFDDQRSQLEAFVTRFYRLCLDRDPDVSGLAGWVNNLLNQILTGADVANGFIYSQEFINKNTSIDEYLTILYRAFFNREPDNAGKQGWLDAMENGATRQDVLNGFLGSQEFIKLCEDYGITPF
jgi:hypothetical protein